MQNPICVDNFINFEKVKGCKNLFMNKKTPAFYK